MRILAVLCQNPFGSFDGGACVIRASLRKLADKGELFVTGFGEDFDRPQIGGHRCAGSLGEARNSRLRFLSAVAQGRCYSVEKYASEEAQRRFVRILGERQYSVIWCEKLQASAVVLQSQRRWKRTTAHCVLRSHNVEHELMDDRYDRSNPAMRALLRLEAERLKDYESAVLEFMDQTFTVTREDREALLELRPGLTERIEYLPVPIETKNLGRSNQGGDGTTILFVGNCRWRPNLLAARWIVEELAPEVKRRIPEAQIRLVGSGTEIFCKAAPNAEGLGIVENLESEYERALCSVAPIRMGSGINVKVLESLAYGVPVVGTAFARRAIDSGAYLEAESVADFVACFCKLREDPLEYQRTRRAARESMTLSDQQFDEAWSRFCMRLAI